MSSLCPKHSRSPFYASVHPRGLLVAKRPASHAVRFQGHLVPSFFRLSDPARHPRVPTRFKAKEPTKNTHPRSSPSRASHPHWVVNVICPHVGIGIVPFWISTALGILGVSVIHTTIGGGLDEMTSAEDFKLISWKNFFMLSAVVFGVMIPVGLRYWFRREVEDVAEAEEELEREQVEGEEEEGEDRILAVGPPPVSKYSTKRPLLATTEGYSSEESDEEGDSDVILESGPLIDVKSADDNDTNNLIVLDPSPSSSRVRL